MNSPKAIGFNPRSSVLGGLKNKGSAGAAAYGQAMAGAAGLNMEKQQADQGMALQQMQQDAGMQRQSDRMNAEGSMNRMQEQVASEGMGSRQKVFDTSMRYQQNAHNAQNNIRRKQMALDIFARML